MIREISPRDAALRADIRYATATARQRGMSRRAIVRRLEREAAKLARRKPADAGADQMSRTLKGAVADQVAKTPSLNVTNVRACDDGVTYRAYFRYHA